MRETERVDANSPRLTPSSHRTAVTSDSVLFGKYELGKLLGCGAFAKVYHARNISTGQSVAVKIITKSKISATSVLVSNIKREISIMRRLSHPNIVKIHEVMATKTKIYVVMEYVKGGELFAKIAKDGRCSEDAAREYFRQLISAVGYCHSRGIYHRDLKPENLLLDDNGDLKVSDFGLSAVKDQQVRSDGLLHTLCGTPAYVAPEILSKKGYDGAKVDVWSCGVVLFVLTAGYLPFHDPNLMGMYKKIYEGKYRCPKWMSSDFKQFLSRLLDTNPNTRITVEEITRHPWFNQNHRVDSNDDGCDFPILKDGTKSIGLMNAFDLISFSSGLDLSGLFEGSLENGERLVLSNSPEDIMEKIDEAVEDERGVRLRRKKDYGVEMEGLDGGSTISLELHMLTGSLVVVDVARRGECSQLYNDLWKNKIKPGIVGLPGQQVVGIAV